MTRCIAFATLLFFWGAAGGALAEDYRSGFGFEISVPDVWLVLTHGEVVQDSNGDVELFLGADGTSAFDLIPVEMREAVLDRVQEGDLEIFYRRTEKSSPFVESVNIMRQASPLPGSLEEITLVCEILPGEFSRVFGRPIAMEACEMREMMGQRALYLQFEGAVEGTKTMQYQLEQSDGITLVLTAIATETNLTRMLSEFESMVASIRLDF
jgi:hypothetical protein